MCGVVVSSEESMEVVSQEDVENEKARAAVKWESFVSGIVLRVLLVEADDSTRQIIAALLRKCSYRVSAVSDGLKAWEILKGKPNGIDLILTEVELPSISGFALLGLIMEHKICKNIPVIMMSSHDSINMVLKCMLNGAADFLIKPVRRNELRNLWRHVWRRHTSPARHGSQKFLIAQCGVEGTSENNAPSEHPREYMSSKQRSKEISVNEGEAQGISGWKCGSASNVSNTAMEKPEECNKLDDESVMPESETRETSIRLWSEAALCNKDYNANIFKLEGDHACSRTLAWDDAVEPESCEETICETTCCDDEMFGPSSEAIDLIGTFDNCLKSSYEHSNSDDGTNNFGWAPQLELSLRRFYPNNSMNEGADESQTMNHSTASAFSWYGNNKTLQPLVPTPTGHCTNLDEGASKSEKHLLCLHPESTASTSSNYLDNMAPLVIGLSNRAEAASPNDLLGLDPVPGVSFENINAVFHTDSGRPSIWHPKPKSRHEMSPFPRSSSLYFDPVTQNLEQSLHWFDETTKKCADENMNEQESNLEVVEKVKHGSPAALQSACSSLCTGAVGYLDGSLCGSICSTSDGNSTSAAAVGSVITPESRSDEVLFIHGGFNEMGSHPSTQREAALTKFRLKRKNRCFEKKVRYQSRKRLAEQRPRVKGQFVHQVRTDIPVTSIDVASKVQ